MEREAREEEKTPRGGIFNDGIAKQSLRFFWENYWGHTWIY